MIIVDPPMAMHRGVYILNQGGFVASNSTLTYFDYATQKSTKDIFSAVNNKPLGALGNDVQIYGSKMYITVNVSSTLEIVDAKTSKLIKHIDMKRNGENQQPRFVVFNKNKAYISSYDNTVAVLDTASLTIEKYITVGRNPEQLAIANNKLYVANSGGLDFDNLDKTVSVIDLSTDTEIKKINVGLNPVTLVADGSGDIYVVSYGDYDKIKPSLTIINSTTDAVKSSAEIKIGYGTQIAIAGNFAFIIGADSKIFVYDTRTDTRVKENFITDGTTFVTPYSISVDNLTGEIFIGDAIDYASDGLVYVYSADGRRKKEIINAGISPGRIIFLDK